MENRLIIFLGVQLSGKTTLAKAISQRNDIKFISLDEIRRELFGPVLSGPKDWLDATRKASEDAGVKRAYERLFEIIEKEANSGQPLIAEMPHLGNREAWLEQIAKSAGAKLKIIWCQINNNNNDDDDDDAELEKRVQDRQANLSAAPISKTDYLMFKKRIREPVLEHLVMDTSQSIETCLTQIMNYLEK